MMKNQNIFFGLIIIVVLFFSSLHSNFGAVKEYYITCEPSDFEEIYSKPFENIYIPVTISYQGQIWTDCEMRIRGETSRWGDKKSLKVKFRAGEFSNGRTTLNLNAEYGDKSYVHNVLASKVFNDAGLTCFHAEYVRLYLNDEYLGLYVQIENMDEQFLEARGTNLKGNLYKATHDGACLSVYDDLYSLWEKKTNESKGRDDLEILRTEINSVPDSAFYEFMQQTFDYDKITKVLAMNMLLSNASTYYHNYYLFNDIGDTKKWLMFPWDMDKTFNTYGYGWHYGWSGAWLFSGNPILERSLLDEKVFSDIRKKVDTLCGTVFNEEYLFGFIDSIASEIQYSVLQDTTDDIQDDLADWNKWINDTKKFIQYRYDRLKDQFQNHPLPFRLHKIEDVYTKDFFISWNRTRTLSNSAVEYKIFLGKKPSEADEETIIVEGIQDTFYLMTNLEEGTYYIKVEAYSGGYMHDAYDRFNKFEVKKATELPCSIDDNLTLTKDESPYYANCAVVVQPGVKLKVEEGVEIRMDGFLNFEVKGEIEINGTENEPVIIRPETGQNKFREFYMESPTGKCTFNHFEIYNGIIKAKKGVYEFDNIKVFINDTTILDDAIYAEDAVFIIENSRIEANGISEGVIVFTSEAPTINNCYAYNTADSYQYVQCNNGVITNNITINSTDDGIDHNGCKNSIISGNLIINPEDKGMSIGHDTWGTCDNITIKRNVIVDAPTGFELKSGSTITLYNNTIFNSVTGIHCYRKIAGSGIVVVDAVNNIISQCEEDLVIANDSKFDLSYSLSDISNLEGESNLFESPSFIDTDNHDFSLNEDSPCIDAGSPYNERDPDGTIADIGAIFFNQGAAKVVINEINYNSSEEYDSGDWVEFYNNSNSDVDVSGWKFKDSDDSHVFVFPESTVLRKYDYIVLCNDLEKFNSIFSSVMNRIGIMEYGLSGAGELIRLYDDKDKLIDFVEYSDKQPWDVDADGKGKSLELINPDMDNSISSSWKASDNNGTPGEMNTKYSNDTSINSMNFDKKIQLYPNPAGMFVIIKSEIDNLKYFSISDMTGRKTNLNWELLSTSEDMSYYYINVSSLSQGQYLFHIGNYDICTTKPLIIIR